MGASTPYPGVTPMEFYELQQIVESNARAIQALADRNAEVTQEN